MAEDSELEKKEKASARRLERARGDGGARGAGAVKTGLAEHARRAAFSAAPSA